MRASTLEQFRKWSTGSSYPAILDEDVKKTLVPIPDREEQDHIARMVVEAMRRRQAAVQRTNAEWRRTLDEISSRLIGHKMHSNQDGEDLESEPPHTIESIRAALMELPILHVDRNGRGQGQLLGN